MHPARSPQQLPRATTRAQFEPVAEEGGGLTQRMVVNVLETFFKRPLVMLAPLLLMLAIGILAASSSEKAYRSTGVLNSTSSDLLADLTDTQTAFTFDTPATITSRSIGEQLQTNSFIDTVIERAGLTGAIETGTRTREQIRSSISTTTRGDNLVAVSATTSTPEESQALAVAALESFREYVIQNDVGDALFKAEKFEDDLVLAREEAETATTELNEYLLGHPAGNEEDRPIAEQIELDSLRAERDRATEAVAAIEAELRQARQEAELARGIVERQLRVLDQPGLPTVAEAGLQSMVLTVGLFVVLGALLTATLVILAAAFDRSVRTPRDIETHFGLDVLAVVPAKQR